MVIEYSGINNERSRVVREDIVWARTDGSRVIFKLRGSDVEYHAYRDGLVSTHELLDRLLPKSLQ